MADSINTSKKAKLGFKESALQFFQTKSDLYVERYSVQAGGDVLWVRHRAILELVTEMNLPHGSRILDLGCGPGLLSFDLARRGYGGIGLDAAPAMIQRCRLGAVAEGISDLWQYQVGDVEALPFQDASFDVAICAGVIEYLPSDENLMREAARVLKSSGRFILCVTNKYGYTVSLSGILHCIERIPGVTKLESMLRRIVVGGKHGAMGFTFRPRKHGPGEVREEMAKHGFKAEKERYAQFTLLPAPFCALTTRLNLNIDEKLAALDRSPLRVFGSCYLVRALIDK